MIQIIYNPTKVLLSEHVSRSVNERLMVFSQFFPAWVYHTMLQYIRAHAHAHLLSSRL